MSRIVMISDQRAKMFKQAYHEMLVNYINSKTGCWTCANEITARVENRYLMLSQPARPSAKVWLLAQADSLIRDHNKVEDRLQGRGGPISIIDALDTDPKCLKKLNRNERAAAKAIYCDGLTWEEAAERLGVTVEKLHEQSDAAKAKLCA
jgi:DNA-directed RNA polymerase specialized sigma24 family protein